MFISSLDGELAIDFIARAAIDPDAPVPHVMLLDLNLPKIDGFEVLRRIRAIEKFKKSIPVIISSLPRIRQRTARRH